MSHSRGQEILNNPRLNKGLGFTLEERQALGIHGLLPPVFLSQDQLVERTMKNIHALPDDLSRYVYLNALQDRDEQLYFRVLTSNLTALTHIVYTPTVGAACKKFGFIYQRPKSVHSLYQRMENEAIVVTDGERILGLGDLGAYGMGIPIGKLSLYVAFAGVQPQWCLPVTLDVGTNTQELLNDPFYTGLRQKRNNGPEYDELVANFFKAITKRYGQNTLIQFEDFGNHNAFTLLAKYRNNYCCFNDDIQGTASVVLAGLLTGSRVQQRKLSDQTILFYGAGEASLGTADLVCQKMVKEGVSFNDAKKRIFIIDSKGLIVKGRSAGGVTEQKAAFAQEYREIKDLEEIVKAVKPSILVGASAVASSFTEGVVKAMGALNEKPIIFALSNPTYKAECTAEQAYTWTNGKALFASGSPFPAFSINGKTLQPGQGNNAFIFPGVALGIVLFKIRTVPDDIFVAAAEALAEWTGEKDIAIGRLYPSLDHAGDISVSIALRIAEYAYKHNLSDLKPEPKNKEAFIRENLHETSYKSALPPSYPWPKEAINPKL